jgi:hypothetical protein
MVSTMAAAKQEPSSGFHFPDFFKKSPPPGGGGDGSNGGNLGGGAGGPPQGGDNTVLLAGPSVAEEEEVMKVKRQASKPVFDTADTKSYDVSVLFGVAEDMGPPPPLPTDL